MKSILSSFTFARGLLINQKSCLLVKIQLTIFKLFCTYLSYILILMIDHHESVRPCVQTMNSLKSRLSLLDIHEEQLELDMETHVYP